MIEAFGTLTHLRKLDQSVKLFFARKSENKFHFIN